MLKTYAKITAGALFKCVWMLALGLLITLLFAIIVFLQNTGLAGSGFTGPITFITSLATHNPCAFTLFIGAPIFILIYIALANKVFIHTVIYEVWKYHEEGFIGTQVKAIVERLTATSDWANKITNEAILRTKLLDANANDSAGSWIKRKIFRYLFKGINLGNINFKAPDLRLSDIILARLNNFITLVSKPSLLLYWLVLGLQLLLFIVAQFMRS